MSDKTQLSVEVLQTILSNQIALAVPASCRNNSIFSGESHTESLDQPLVSHFPFDGVSAEHDEPFKKQQGWGLSIQIPEFACGLCGAPVGGVKGFCSLCHIKQERVVFQATYDRCHQQYAKAKFELQAAKDNLKRNTEDQRRHRV